MLMIGQQLFIAVVVDVLKMRLYKPEHSSRKAAVGIVMVLLFRQRHLVGGGEMQTPHQSVSNNVMSKGGATPISQPDLQAVYQAT